LVREKIKYLQKSSHDKQRKSSFLLIRFSVMIGKSFTNFFSYEKSKKISKEKEAVLGIRFIQS
jgi:hypothetical protein